MSRVVVDCSAVQYQPCGFRRFTESFMRALILEMPGPDFEFWSDCVAPGYDPRLRHVPRHRFWDSVEAKGGCVYHDLTSGVRMAAPETVPAGCRLLVTLHDVIPGLPGAGAADAVEEGYLAKLKAVVRRADRLVTISESSRSEICSTLGIDPALVDVVYPGVERFGSVDKTTARQSLRRLGVPEDGPLIGTLGSNRQYKNTVEVLAAFLVLLRTMPTARLVVAGEFSPNTSTAQLARLAANGLRNVSVLGRIDDDQLGTLYQACDVFVYPSRFEGFGSPPLEAALCGTPIIVSDIGVYREFLGRDGVFVSPDDPRQLAREIVECLRDGHEARNRVRRVIGRLGSLTWRRCVSKYIELYEDVGEHSNRSGLSRVADSLEI